MIDFRTEPSRWKHWRLSCEGAVATLTMDVDAAAPLLGGYELKLNSYDLGVDIELADAVRRLRFEHPEVRAVVLKSGKEGVFCAGANIRMLAKASHAHKVAFCKFTNETRLAIEDASAESGQRWIAAISGSAAGGGYELALTADHIMLVDDRRSSVSLPELPLLAVLPGTGGLTRLTDKRRVRRDLADAFCTTEEGVRGRRAVSWRLVDEVVPPSAWDDRVRARAAELAGDAPAVTPQGIALPMLQRQIDGDRILYQHVSVTLDRAVRRADVLIKGPTMPPGDMYTEGATFWPLAMGRELDDAILHLRLNEPELGLITFRTAGDPALVLAYDAALAGDGWLAREIRLLLKAVLKRIDMTSRSLIALIEPESCFAGTLAELAFAADQAMMHAGGGNQAASLTLSAMNLGPYPMGNGLTRLANRFAGEADSLAAAQGATGQPLAAEAAEAMGLVTRALDEIDWNDEIRVALEERASFSPDALTGLEANLRLSLPETMETRIFGRLTAWQNWIFQRPNAVGETGSLKRYGSGVRPDFDPARV